VLVDADEMRGALDESSLRSLHEGEDSANRSCANESTEHVAAEHALAAGEDGEADVVEALEVGRSEECRRWP
jgi:hypothetical protein